MKSKGINQQSNNNKWHIKTKKISICQLFGVGDSCLKKIEVIIVEHIAYEGHEDAELKYTRVAS